MCCWYNTERRSIFGAGLFVSVTVDLFVMRGGEFIRTSVLRSLSTASKLFWYFWDSCTKLNQTQWELSVVGRWGLVNTDSKLGFFAVSNRFVESTVIITSLICRCDGKYIFCSSAHPADQHISAIVCHIYLLITHRPQPSQTDQLITENSLQKHIDSALAPSRWSEVQCCFQQETHLWSLHRLNSFVSVSRLQASLFLPANLYYS